MNNGDLITHLNDGHDFDASAVDDFVRGVHHGLHVAEGRAGEETHVHAALDGDDR